LLLGDIPSRVRLLLNAGQIQLAYMTAITHGLDDMAEQIRSKLQHMSGSDEPLGNIKKK
jgi:coatomer protein complex subunit alpha (xenin)